MEPMIRNSFAFRGRVQGIGFRPFVLNLARSCDLVGFVRNTGSGVSVEAQGSKLKLDYFLKKVFTFTRIDFWERQIIECKSFDNTFTIEPSTPSGSGVELPVDVAICELCEAELLDPNNRRYRYPYISCSQCGPRYSILQKMPWDRNHATFRAFTPCRDCLQEYNDPFGRRFHSQTIGCHQCGPQAFWNEASGHTEQGKEAFQASLQYLKQGKAIALKSVGGYQLLCSVNATKALHSIRTFKSRPSKALAVMMLPQDLDQYTLPSAEERRAYLSGAGPIVLMLKRSIHDHAIAPDNPYWGVMRPTSGMHSLLLREVGTPLVVTSANLRGNPLIYSDDKAKTCLSEICAGVLRHDLAIQNPIDDSLIRFCDSSPILLRLGRGLAPSNLNWPHKIVKPKVTALATGAHDKNSWAISTPCGLIFGPYIGDLTSTEALERAQSSAMHALNLTRQKIDHLVCDLHPEYGSTFLASTMANNLDQGHIRDGQVNQVPHHVAHFHALLAEVGIDKPVLGFVFDGTGLGPDGASWGSEGLYYDPSHLQCKIEHIASVRPISLPGGEASIRDVRRLALTSLWDAGAKAMPSFAPEFSTTELTVFRHLYDRKSCFQSRGMGRLFDAVAGILGLIAFAEYDGQAAMQVKWHAMQAQTKNLAPWNLTYDSSSPLEWDWRPVILALHEDFLSGCSKEDLCFRWHLTIAHWMMTVAHHQAFGPEKLIGLTGGCFQNALLVKLVKQAAKKHGYQVLMHRVLPPHDGNIGVGQASADFLGEHDVPWGTGKSRSHRRRFHRSRDRPL